MSDLPELAVIIIASEKRRTTTFSAVLESAREQEPDELVVVADFPVEADGVRSFMMQPMLHNTIDALVKRDIGTVATVSPNLCYLCDDHILAPKFVSTFRHKYAEEDWSMLAPYRFTARDGQQIPLPMGEDYIYVGGHAGIFRRYWIQQLPWAAGPHHPNWDLYHCHALRRMGASIRYAESDLAIEDIEPGAQPWR